jgi:hypothetical protein
MAVRGEGGGKGKFKDVFAILHNHSTLQADNPPTLISLSHP